MLTWPKEKECWRLALLPRTPTTTSLVFSLVVLDLSSGNCSPNTSARAVQDFCSPSKDLRWVAYLAESSSGRSPLHGLAL